MWPKRRSGNPYQSQNPLPKKQNDSGAQTQEQTHQERIHLYHKRFVSRTLCRWWCWLHDLAQICALMGYFQFQTMIRDFNL
jgi:hypothetical protein